MVLEEKKARIRELLLLLSEDQEDARAWFGATSPAFGNRSPRSFLDANDEVFIDLMLGLLERSFEALQEESMKDRGLPTSALN